MILLKLNAENKTVDSKIFWERANSLLRAKGFSQHSLSKKCGFTNRRIENLSSSCRFPTTTESVRIAKELDTTVEFLVTGIDDPIFTTEERTLLDGFRQLDERDKADIMGIIKMKLDYGKKDATLSNSGNA